MPITADTAANVTFGVPATGYSDTGGASAMPSPATPIASSGASAALAARKQEYRLLAALRASAPRREVDEQLDFAVVAAILGEDGDTPYIGSSAYHIITQNR